MHSSPEDIIHPTHINGPHPDRNPIFNQLLLFSFLRLFRRCSQARRCQDLHAHETGSQSSPGEGDQMVRLSLADAKVFRRGESCIMSS